MSASVAGWLPVTPGAAQCWSALRSGPCTGGLMHRMRPAAVKAGQRAEIDIRMCKARVETETALSVCIQKVLDRTGLQPHQACKPSCRGSWIQMLTRPSSMPLMLKPSACLGCGCKRVAAGRAWRTAGPASTRSSAVLKASPCSMVFEAACEGAAPAGLQHSRGRAVKARALSRRWAA